MPPSVDAITVTRPVPRSSDHAEVELARDVDALLDEQALDLLALGAGLVRDQLHAEDLRGACLGVVARLGDLDAAALAAAAGVDLRLDHDDLVAGLGDQLLGRRLAPRRGCSAGRPLGTGTPYFLQELLGLVLVDLHRARLLALTASSRLRSARARPRPTCRASPSRRRVSSMSTIFSTPPRADDDRHADVEVLVAVLALEVRGARRAGASASLEVASAIAIAADAGA